LDHRENIMRYRECQAEHASSALVTIGSMYHDPSALMLRRA
jgi:hypothetical protein